MKKVIGKIILNSDTAERFLKNHPEKYRKEAELPNGKWRLQILKDDKSR